MSNDLRQGNIVRTHHNATVHAIVWNNDLDHSAFLCMSRAPLEYRVGEYYTDYNKTNWVKEAVVVSNGIERVNCARCLMMLAVRDKRIMKTVEQMVQTDWASLKLKEIPCPKCQGIGKLFRNGMDKTRTWHRVWCSNCGRGSSERQVRVAVEARATANIA